MDLDSGIARRLRKAFPSALVTEVDAMLKLVDIGEHEPSDQDIGPVLVNGEVLHIPARIYSAEVGADALVGLTTVIEQPWIVSSPDITTDTYVRSTCVPSSRHNRSGFRPSSFNSSASTSLRSISRFDNASTTWIARRQTTTGRISGDH